MTRPVIASLGGLARLSSVETELLRRLADNAQAHPVGEVLAVRPNPSPRPRYVLSGWAARQRVLSDGRRQIISFLLPGDSLEGREQHLARAAFTVVALTPMTTADASYLVAELERGDPAHDGLRAARGLAVGDDVARLIDHLVRIARLGGYERMVNLMLELHGRLASAGLAEGNSCPMPVTQEALGDALGFSTVHVNRIMQRLRREGLVRLRQGRLELLEPEALAKIASLGSPAAL